MASTEFRGPLGHTVRFHEEDYQRWRDHFAEQSRQEMITDDLLAGESVSAEMISIIVVGLVIAVVTLVFFIA